jgi:peptidyl-prolyl cis-trans isomerase C
MMTSPFFARSLAAMLVVGVAMAGSAAFAQDESKRVRATVDGEEITQADVEGFIAQLAPQVQAAPRAQIEPAVVEQLVNSKLIVRMAKAAGIEQDDDYKNELEAISLRILQNVYLRKQIDARLTDERLQKLYDEFVAANPPADQVRASHILVESKEEAQAIVERVKGGDDFADVAREKSTGPSAGSGGDLGYFERGQMVPTFSDAAFALEVDEISEPVQTQFGWHVIKVTDRRQAPAPTLDEMRGELSQQLTNDIVDEIIDGARGNAKIVLFDAEGKPVEQ